MSQLVQFLFDLCLLRRKPQDLPASTTLFWLLLIANLLIGMVGAARMFDGPAQALLAAILDALILLGLLYLALRWQGRLARLMQAATAIFGVSALIGAVGLPLQLTVAGAEAGQPVGSAIALAYLALLIWIQLAIGHVLRHTFELPLPGGIAMALVYSIISGTLIQSILLG